MSQTDSKLVADRLELAEVEVEMFRAVLGEWPLLGEWFLRQLRERERVAIEGLVAGVDVDVERGRIKALRSLRDMWLTLKGEVTGGEDE